jgi:hypothetical protein
MAAGIHLLKIYYGPVIERMTSKNAIPLVYFIIQLSEGIGYINVFCFLILISFEL